MDYNVELRYYELLFQKLVLSFHHHYTLDRLTTFIEMISYIADANTLVIGTAMQRILANDTLLKFNKIEYIICLKLCSGLSDTDIRKTVRCSPNTIQNAMEDYKTNQIYVHPRFDLLESNEIRKVMKGFKNLANIY
jgi:hypothetical protein